MRQPVSASDLPPSSGAAPSTQQTPPAVEGPRAVAVSIWWFAFGYFAAYAPYSAITKALSKGQLPGVLAPLDGFAMLPVVVMSSTVGMFAFLTAMGWWRFAPRRRIGSVSLPWPRPRTALSGACTAAIVVTTTLAYTFEGISIVFAMLLMRGGVLVTAPVVDALSRRRVRWYSWAALVLSLLALVVAFAEKGGFDLSVAAAVDIALYLLAYFVRLRIMSGAAKSDDENENRRYFVEEQMVATPLVVLTLALWAATGVGDVASELRHGFLDLWSGPMVVFLVVIGLLSQGTGIFGGLILLDKRENTFCVPVNRASSVLAGLVASFAMVALLDSPPPSVWELAGAGLILGAIVVLSIPPLLEKRAR